MKSAQFSLYDTLAIVGSTELEGNVEAYSTIFYVVNLYKPVRGVSGGAKGIDSMAKEVFDFLGIPFTEHLPEYQAWPAFKKRNELIAQDCTRLVRIVSGTTRTYGSGWTRDRAAALGRQTEEYVIYL